MKTAQDFLDLLELVSFIGTDDIKAMLEAFGYDGVEHELRRATSNLEDLYNRRVEVYNELLKTK